MTQAFAALRLLYSRIGSMLCPNGHRAPASPENAVSPERTCPTCGVHFEGFSAEDFAFNSAGACPRCDGLGVEQQIDPATIIPDPSKSLQDGAVAPWNGLMRSQMPRVVAELGVRIDVPWVELTPAEQELVLHGPEVKREIIVPTRTGRAVPLNAVYTNAYLSVEQLKGEGKGDRAQRFLVSSPCSLCHGSRLRPELLTAWVDDLTIAQACELEADRLRDWLLTVPGTVPEAARVLAQAVTTETVDSLAPMITLGLGYLNLSRAGATLSTGERQRLALGRTVLSHGTGLLLVLDEPTVGLHPDNVAGLVQLMDDLVSDGNTVVVVDHDVQVLRAADQLLELGPGAGDDGGYLVDQGTPEQLARNPDSRIGPYLAAPRPIRGRPARPVAAPLVAGQGEAITLKVEHHLNLNQVQVIIPTHRLTAVAGVSGAGKSALVVDQLVPALRQQLAGQPLPASIGSLVAPTITRVEAVDSTPVGRNARSTMATYSGVFDAIRALFAGTDHASDLGWTMSHFSYNTADGQCPECLGTGELSLDLQYLPDLPMTCPRCQGHRYRPEVEQVSWHGLTITQVLSLTASQALGRFADQPRIARTLQALVEVGLGYLTLGEATPALSGGEAQRLRLAKEIRKGQKGTLFVFDEPSIGLHPADVQVLLAVMERLIDRGATVLVIEHDLDLIAGSDWVIELGPGAGARGGRVIATGTPEDVATDLHSVIGRWL